MPTTSGSASKNKSTARTKQVNMELRWQVRDLVNPIIKDYKAIGVLSALMDRMPNCFPSYDQLAADTGMSKSSVQRGLTRLQELELIEMKNRGDASNEFFLKLDGCLTGQCDHLHQVTVTTSTGQRDLLRVQPKQANKEKKHTKDIRSDRPVRKLVVKKHSLRNSTKASMEASGQTDLMTCSKHGTNFDEDNCGECYRAYWRRRDAGL